MKVAKLDSMVKGWFIGNFEPSLYETNDVEIAIKHYKSGDYEDKHFHKIATEITVIVSGEAKINGDAYSSGDIIVLSPYEVVDFLASTDLTTVVVKIPGANNDKYFESDAGK